MKKLMIGLFAVCAAVAAQAAYVDWSYEGKNAKNDTSWGTSTETAANGYTAYLLTASDWNNLTTNNKRTAADIASKALDSSTLIYEKTVKSVAYYTTHADGGTTASARQVEADSGNFYIILANDDGYSIAADNVAITAYSDAAQGGTGLTSGLTLAAQDNTAMVAAKQAYDVPEPTSGLLMLAGLAALALRRRKA